MTFLVVTIKSMCLFHHCEVRLKVAQLTPTKYCGNPPSNYGWIALDKQHSLSPEHGLCLMTIGVSSQSFPTASCHDPNAIFSIRPDTWEVPTFRVNLCGRLSPQGPQLKLTSRNGTRASTWSNDSIQNLKCCSLLGLLGHRLCYVIFCFCILTNTKVCLSQTFPFVGIWCVKSCFFKSVQAL